MSKGEDIIETMDKDTCLEHVIQALEASGTIADSWVWGEEHKVPHGVVVGALKSLASRDIVILTPNSVRHWSVKPEGMLYIKEGTPEAQVYNAVPAEGITLDGLKGLMNKNTVGVGVGPCMRLKWLRMEGKEKILRRNADSIIDTVRTQLEEVLAGTPNLDDKALIALKKRKLIDFEDRTVYTVKATDALSRARLTFATDLTAAMLQDGSWSTSQFKDYNFDALGVAPDSGHLHPLLKVRDEIRSVFLGLGFEEMPTNRFVESSFWNFDALFQPQAHPARDMHDTFFIEDPAVTVTLPPKYADRVKSMHENGGGDSIGWRYDWKESETRKNLLRTHTTAISSRVLFKVAQDCMRTGVFKPHRFFSVDRVFRNESLDATHLAEFHQIEGIVMDRNLSLSDLVGVVSQFFEQTFGLTELRFKPAYNPYTEPSMEIFGYMDSLNKWVEVGNSGMFRPEMTEPMGLPESVRCIAFGLSVERPVMMKYNINNIRNLVGHKMPLGDIETHSICRLNEFH